MPPSTSNQNQKSANWLNFFIWIAIALVLRWQVIEPRWIPSGSMLPTLQLQDRILVEMIRPRLNQIQKTTFTNKTMVVFHPPKRLVDRGYDPNSALIKRIIGVAGDQISVHGGQLFRNGKIINESWLTEPIEYEMELITVPEDQLWVLGDNRNNSLDSHVWGPLPQENVIGTAIWRYWPINKFGPIRFPLHSKIEPNDLTAIRSKS